MIKQYVNLPSRAADHHGAIVSVEVEASRLGAEAIAYTEWWVEATGSDNTDPRFLSRAERARMTQARARNRASKFRNSVILPHVGGDRHTVNCSKAGDRSSPVSLEELETWRKIFYTVHYMNNACRDTFNAVKTRFENAFKDEAFIELEQKAINQTLVDEPRTRSTNSLPHLYARRPPLTDKPFHLRIVVLNDIFDVEANLYDETAIASKTHTINTDAPLSDVSPTHWISLAQARVEPRGSWISIRSMVSKTGDQTISIDVSGQRALSQAIDNGRTIQIRIRTRERNHYLGHSIGNFCCVRINETGTATEIERTILQTFTHEVGHGFQQTIRRERTYDASGNFDRWDNNILWHDDAFGGQGPHCSKNARIAADPATTSGQTYEHQAGTLCTMFFRDDPAVDADGKFCDSCTPRLRRVKLDAPRMRAQGWARF